jgi:hypothetical protein
MISPVAMHDYPSSVSACGGPATLLGQTGGREKFPYGSLFRFAARPRRKSLFKTRREIGVWTAFPLYRNN